MRFKTRTQNAVKEIYKNLEATQDIILFLAGKLNIDIVSINETDTERIIKKAQDGYVQIAENEGLIILAKEINKKKK